jgi:hypothetical protein
MEALYLNTISWIYETHLSGGLDKTTSDELWGNLTDNPHFFATVDYLAKQHREKLFHNKFSSKQINAVQLFNSEHKHEQKILNNKLTSPRRYDQ